MDINTLTTFFMWCAIINISIFVLWLVFILFAPDFTYRLQTRFFPMPRETYNVVVYCFLGLYKVVVIVFVFVPYLALLIIQR